MHRFDVFARFIALSAAFVVGASAANAELVDQVLAVVGDRVVTSSDLAIYQDLLPHSGCPEPVLCDPERTLLDRAIDAAVIRGLAGDMAAYRPSTDDLERRLTAVRSTWDSSESYSHFLARYGLTENDLAGILFSQMVVERFTRRTLGYELVSRRSEDRTDLDLYREWISAQRQKLPIRTIVVAP